MAIAKKCDICGKLYEVYNNKAGDDPNGLKFLNITANREFYNSSELIDCCPDCMKSILQLIQRLKRGGND